MVGVVIQSVVPWEARVLSLVSFYAPRGTEMERESLRRGVNGG